jgi:putative transposase
MLGELVKAVLERALECELTAHLGYDRHDRGGAGNARNGSIAKTVQTGVGPVPLRPGPEQSPRHLGGTERSSLL